MSTRTCQNCGQEFQAIDSQRKRRKFCSQACSRVGQIKGGGAQLGATNGRWSGGKSVHPLYARYLDMIARCYRPTHHAYARYGGRGITVASEWREDFWAFVAAVGTPPEGTSLDRIDNDKGYKPGNVRWATPAEQSKNRRTSGWEKRVRTASGRFQ